MVLNLKSKVNYHTMDKTYFSNHALSFILVLREPIWTARVIFFSYRYEDTIIFYGIYLDSLQIVPCNPQKHHPIPADVLPNDSEDLFPKGECLSTHRVGPLG